MEERKGVSKSTPNILAYKRAANKDPDVILIVENVRAEDCQKCKRSHWFDPQTRLGCVAKRLASSKINGIEEEVDQIERLAL